MELGFQGGREGGRETLQLSLRTAAPPPRPFPSCFSWKATLYLQRLVCQVAIRLSSWALDNGWEADGVSEWAATPFPARKEENRSWLDGAPSGGPAGLVHTCMLMLGTQRGGLVGRGLQALCHAGKPDPSFPHRWLPGLCLKRESPPSQETGPLPKRAPLRAQPKATLLWHQQGCREQEEPRLGCPTRRLLDSVPCNPPTHPQVHPGQTVAFRGVPEVQITCDSSIAALWSGAALRMSFEDVVPQSGQQGVAAAALISSCNFHRALRLEIRLKSWAR